jgi:hypothetical protein
MLPHVLTSAVAETTSRWADEGGEVDVPAGNHVNLILLKKINK